MSIHLFHRYKPVSTYIYKEVSTHFPGRDDQWPAYTRVVSRCTVCGKLKSKRLDGKHNLEDLIK